MTIDPPKASKLGRWQFSLRTLLILHVVASLVACWLFGILSPITPFARFAFTPLFWAQMCLLGIWLALGTNTRQCRAAGAIVGIAYLVMIPAYSGHFPFGRFLSNDLPSIALQTVAIASVLLVVRVWKAHVVAYRSEPPATAVEGLRFSIRHLFLLTTAVAVLLVMAQGVGLLWANVIWLRPAVGGGMSTVGFIAITITAVWAGLGIGRPNERIIVVMLLASFIGVLFAYVLEHRTTNMESWQYMWYYPTMMFMTTAVIIASLLVVRSKGYRLVRRSP